MAMLPLNMYRVVTLVFLIVILRPVLVRGSTGGPSAQAPVQPFVCSVTRSDAAPYGNDALETALPPEGKLLVRRDEGGKILDDGSLSIEWKWRRKTPGQLVVAGVRFDQFGPPLRALTPRDDGTLGPVSSQLIFPGPGCWQITGRVGDKRLTFTVLVETAARRSGP